MENTLTILDVYNYLTCCHTPDERCSKVVEGLKKWLNSKGYDLLDTRGLPFNGTTYEIISLDRYDTRRYGHIKTVYEIYGNKATLFIYPAWCRGGSHLNGDELKEYYYSLTFKQRSY